jgi:hypothetical protein
MHCCAWISLIGGLSEVLFHLCLILLIAFSAEEACSVNDLSCVIATICCHPDVLERLCRVRLDAAAGEEAESMIDLGQCMAPGTYQPVVLDSKTQIEAVDLLF